MEFHKKRDFEWIIDICLPFTRMMEFLKKRDGGLGINSNHARLSASSRNAKTDASIGGGFTIIVVLAVIIMLIRAIS